MSLPDIAKTIATELERSAGYVAGFPYPPPFYRPADDATGLYEGKPDTSNWREAIAKYDADVASGVIRFDNGSEFATDYPGKAETDESIHRFIGNHVPD